ncbi:hypothetical protein SGLAD_v1c03010 [Spiroplasma gladiatoris]|uniref:Uncharacterized protein n=1 Tax=Spiroplasma gladiatoris TaxID=2143 RepID=A0A4P7AJ00_9MOLU|nr:hypothetical protein [Spiroplasma gladiatoris]QBQ07500.1 hypothetical protein SGLAD_v1c03010 [Spiroplasma gladiatoris]
MSKNKNDKIYKSLLIYSIIATILQMLTIFGLIYFFVIFFSMEKFSSINSNGKIAITVITLSFQFIGVGFLILYMLLTILDFWGKIQANIILIFFLISTFAIGAILFIPCYILGIIYYSRSKQNDIINIADDLTKAFKEKFSQSFNK